MWLKLEAETNAYLAHNSLINNKKDDEILKTKASVSWFKISSHQKLKLEWQSRVFSFPITFAFPILLQYYLFQPESLTLWRGLINYAGLLFVPFLLSKQPHRINHIAGLENPFHIGFFATCYIHNYGTFFFNLMDCNSISILFKHFKIQIYIYLLFILLFKAFNIFRIYDMFSITFLIFHTYCYYKVMTSDQGKDIQFELISV
jgi:hypothetical protein